MTDSALPSTVITYGAGSLAERARVLAVTPLDAGPGVIVDRTPFHPVDHSWPDQPADRGTVGGREVLDCLTGAVDPLGTLQVGEQITAHRGDGSWTWVVVHVLAPDSSPLPVAEVVDLVVDGDYRLSLSAAHTACHLAALALNDAARPLWRKPPGRLDGLGAPDLDALAITSSTIRPWRSTDVYRLGKSIRKKGLDRDGLLAGLPDLADHVTRRLREWVALGGPVSIDDGGDPTVAARRTWVCQLPEGLATFPCGGTHLHDITDLPASLSVAYHPIEDGFVAETLLR